MKILCRKQFGKLLPIDDAGEAEMRRIKNGALVQIEIKQPRNVAHLRKYWALVSLVAENTERYQNAETVHEALKISVGLRTEIELPGGVKGYIPGSIAFHKMDQGEFSAFFERACDAVAKYFLPGVTSEDLKREVESMIGAAV
jgi:hypothetical protein